MKPSGDLFNLIRSLSPAERRFFRLGVRSQANGQPPLYLRLFDLLAGLRGSDYEEDRVKAHFEGEPCLRQFTRTKNYLYGRLLISLRTFHAENSARRRCLSHLDAADLLAARQLPRQALLQAERASHLARRYALSELLPAAQAWERRLHRLLNDKDQGDALADLDREEAEASAQLRSEQALNALYDRFWLLSKRRRALAALDPEAVEVLRSDAALDIPAEQLGFGGQLARTLCLALYHRLRGELDLSHGHYRKAVQCWEDRAELAEAFPERFLRAAAAFLYSGHAIGDYSEYGPLLARIRADAKLKGVDRARISAMAFNLQLLYHLNRRPLHGTEELVGDLAAELEAGLVPLSVWIPAATNLAIYHFLREDFGGARRWISQLLDLKRGPEWTDLRELARLLWLLVLYERQDWTLLAYALRSMVRYVQHRRPLNALEEQARTFFGAVDRNPDFVARIEALREWGARLGGAELEGLMGAELFRIWAAARLRNLSLEEVRLEGLGGD